MQVSVPAEMQSAKVRYWVMWLELLDALNVTQSFQRHRHFLSWSRNSSRPVTPEVSLPRLQDVSICSFPGLG